MVMVGFIREAMGVKTLNSVIGRTNNKKITGLWIKRD